MEHQQLIEFVQSQLERHKNNTSYDNPHWSSINDLEQLLDLLESQEDNTVAEENKPQFLMTDVLPPIDVHIRVFYVNFWGIKLNDIMYVIPEYNINDFRVIDDEGFYGLAYGWSYATEEEIAEYVQ